MVVCCGTQLVSNLAVNSFERMGKIGGISGIPNSSGDSNHIIFRNHLEIMSNAKGDELMKQVIVDSEYNQ